MTEMRGEIAPTLLSVTELSAAYFGHEVLHGISLSVPERSIVALVGHNGSGKSTLLRCMFGRHEATRGEVRFRDEALPRVGTRSRLTKEIVYVPQKGNIFPSLTVRENLLFALEASTVPRAEFDQSLEDVFELFPNIPERLAVKAGSLSGGQRQAVAVAMGLVRRPALLLLDEPTIGISPNLVQRLMASLQAARTQLSTSIVIGDQAVSAALDASDYCYVLRSGRVVIDGPSAKVKGTDQLWSYF